MRAVGVAVVALAVLGGCGDDAGGGRETCSRVSGTICTIAGTGIAGDGTDGLSPHDTMLYSPADIAFAPDHSLVIVDWNNHRIRQVQPDGRLKIVAGVGELGDGLGTDSVTTRLNHPTDVTFDAAGRMVIAAWHNSRVKRCDLHTGDIEDIAGTGMRGYGGDDGPALSAILNLPASVVYDPEGNLFVSDQANQRIRRIDKDGKISTFAGSGKKGFGGDGGPALEAQFSLPVGQQGHPAAHIARDAAGNFFVADTENNRVRKIGADGIVSTVAGNGEFAYLGDGGPASAAALAGPVDVAVGPDGAIYVADTENNCVRMVRDGIISTVAGVCGACDVGQPCRCPSDDLACLGDNAPAKTARLLHPSGIAFDPEGNLAIADTLHHRIRIVYR